MLADENKRTEGFAAGHTGPVLRDVVTENFLVVMGGRDGEEAVAAWRLAQGISL